jgi:hypothetical protein
MAMGIHTIGAIGASRCKIGENSIVAFRETPMITPVTTAARNAIVMPHMTRIKLEDTAFQTGTACEPSPILKEFPDMATRKTLGGGATAAKAEPSCRPTNSQNPHSDNSEIVPKIRGVYRPGAFSAELPPPSPALI